MQYPLSDADRARQAFTLINSGQLKVAERTLKDILRQAPSQPDALLGLGVLCGMRGDDLSAVKNLRRAAQKAPENEQVHYNLGQALIRLGRFTEAAEALATAAARAASPLTHEKLGDCLRHLGRFEAAIEHYRTALKLAGRGATGMLLSSLVETQRRVCDWQGLEASEAQLLGCAARGDPVEPLLLLHVTDDPALAHRNATAYAATFLPPAAASSRFAHPTRTRERLRIGYLCSDFRQHATAQLIADLFECHDKTRFEIVALSFGPADDSPLRRRITAAVDRFVDLARFSDADIAKRIHAAGIDILVDLNGYIANARPLILAARPAPVQCHYLAFPGTLGSPAIDTMLVDPVIAPEGADAHYTEKLIRLPDCYQPNDRRREVATPAPSRSDCGLPETDTVLASFNNPLKLTPAMFAVWMRVLAACPGSVLWLFSDATSAPDNLRAAATTAGIPPERLVFATYAEPNRHLARLANADLILDCFPYGAHTTASDALWMGVPVLTLAGRSFASRVCASLLTAVGCPELIMTSLADYEREAIALANAPDRISGFKRRLAASRATCPLFDTPRLARSIEAAFVAMERKENGDTHNFR